MGYTKNFTRPYETYKERPDKTTPVTAEIKNMETDTFESIEDYLANGVPASDLVTDDEHLTVTKEEKTKWNAGGGGTVKSVNSKTPDAKGNVHLDANDVNALPIYTKIPTKLSDLESDAEHRTVSDLQIQRWNAGGEGGKGTVVSVNNQEPDETGNVYLTLDDVYDGEEYINVSKEDFINFSSKYTLPEGGIPEGDLDWMLQAKIDGAGVDVIDNLESEDATSALSARQGKVLDEKIDERSQGFSYDEAESKLTFSGAIGGSGLHVYSDEEHVVGIWKDGDVEKPVYEKKFYIPSLNNTEGDKYYDIGITNIEKIIDYNVIFNFSNGVSSKNIHMDITESKNIIVARFSGNNLMITTGKGRDGVNADGNIQYTKTTD